MGIFLLTGNFFFSVFAPFFPKKLLKFLTQRISRNKIFAAARLAKILAARWTGNKLFLRVPWECIQNV